MKTDGLSNALIWLWLQRRLKVGSHVIRIVTEIEGGARFVYESSPDALWSTGRFSLKTINSLNDRNLDAERRILERCEELGISVTTPDDADYPRRLLSIEDPPAVLFYKGDLAKMCARPTIAIVGTRNATDYGMRTAYELAQRLSRAGMTVVSGCARGIDTAAHNGALAANNGGTIAVLGCGIAYRYNMDNAELREAIAEKGALISEYAPDADASAYHFPVRNRIISGLSLGTVVIEADAKSGSLITARKAHEQGRDVFVTPAGLGMRNSSGVIGLCKEGLAKQIDCPLDILGDYASMYPMHLTLEGAERKLMFGEEPRRLPEVKPPDPMPSDHLNKDFSPPADTPPEGISEEAGKLYAYLSAQPRLLDDLAEQAGVAQSEALVLITELELLGCVTAHPGGRYSLK